MKLKVEGTGFQRMDVDLLTGGKVTDWLVTAGKLAGQPLSIITNPRWIAFNIWRLKGMNPAMIPSGLMESLRERWLSVYKFNVDRDVDPGYLDRLDPSIQFDWNESPPDRGDIGLITEKDMVDEVPSIPMFTEEEQEVRKELPNWLR
jgi:hypothetical protein